jgi:DHA2 family multidrug resistance protein
VDSPATRANRAALLRRGLRIDYVGFALVAAAFGTLQLVLDRFERAGGWGTPFVNLYGSFCVVALVALVLWEWHHPQPVMNLRLLRSPSFAISNVLMFALGFVLLSTTQLLPQFAQSLLGYDAQTSGLTLGLAGIATIVAMPLAGIVTGRLVQPRILACMAFAGVGFALWWATNLDLDIDFWQLSTIRLLQAIWMPFLFIPITSISLVGVPPAQNNEASALVNLMRNLGGSFGISYTTTLLAYREQFHHARLAEHVTPYNGYGFGVPLAPIVHAIDRQAGMQTYLDLFQVLAIVSLCAAPLSLLLPRMTKGARAAAH